MYLLERKTIQQHGLVVDKFLEYAAIAYHANVRNVLGLYFVVPFRARFQVSVSVRVPFRDHPSPFVTLVHDPCT
jgi:hypothetical protein